MEKKHEYKLPETLSMLMAEHPKTREKTTHKALAAAIGLRQQTVSQYIKGSTVPTAKILLAIADYFGVSTNFLLLGYEDNDLYGLMMDAEMRRIYEKLGSIAVYCSNAEDVALKIMKSEAERYAQE